MSELAGLFTTEEAGMITAPPPEEVETIEPPRRPRKQAVIPENWEPEIKVPHPKDLEVEIDYDHAHTVLDVLLDAYTNNKFPYNQDNVRLPQDPRHMPENLVRDTVDHANLLFNVCYYMRGGVKSVAGFKRVAKIFEDRPDLFRPEEAAKATPEDITAELVAHGLGFHKVVPNQWITNAQRLVDRYEGDPRNIFAGVDSYDEALNKVKNRGRGRGFIGFKEKMTSMLTYYLMDEKLIEPFMFPIPVDLHVMRVSVANRIATFPNAEPGTNLYSEVLLSKLRELYVDYAVEKNVDPLRLCDAVWLLSESTCGTYPGNKTFEPYGRKNRDGRNTVLIPQAVDVKDRAQKKAYNSSCRPCPIEPYCELSIPGAPYYIAGGLVIRGHRVRFPLEEKQGELELNV